MNVIVRRRWIIISLFFFGRENHLLAFCSFLFIVAIVWLETCQLAVEYYDYLR